MSPPGINVYETSLPSPVNRSLSASEYQAGSVTDAGCAFAVSTGMHVIDDTGRSSMTMQNSSSTVRPPATVRPKRVTPGSTPCDSPDHKRCRDGAGDEAQAATCGARRRRCPAADDRGVALRFDGVSLEAYPVLEFAEARERGGIAEDVGLWPVGAPSKRVELAPLAVRDVAERLVSHGFQGTSDTRRDGSKLSERQICKFLRLESASRPSEVAIA